MAAAYMFHLVMNHPFADGNKRTGLMSALVFLMINRIEIDATDNEIYDLTIGVTMSEIDKADIAEFFKTHAVDSTP